MNARHSALATRIAERFGAKLIEVPSRCGDLTYEVEKTDLVEVATALRDEPELRFEMLVDLCGVDYLVYGTDEWDTTDATNSGFSRAAEWVPAPSPTARIVEEAFDARRFAVVYHLLSISGNYRLRLRTFAGAANPPVVPSVIPVWAGADWYEREAFDLYGILFDGHPDLRRLLTDYGFIGHPFRKDFPISGNVEVIYDPQKGRVIYQPVTIDPRVLVPKIIRDDNRYTAEIKDKPANG